MRHTIKLCPYCLGRAIILPRPKDTLSGDGVRAQCLSCRAHTVTVDAQNAGSMKAAFYKALILWNEGRIKTE